MTCIRISLVKRIVALALVVLMAAGIVACAPKENPTAGVKEQIMPTPSPVPSPVSGGELRLPMPTNADLSDPLAVNTEEMLAFFSLIYEGLLSVDSTGKLQPALAENWSCDASGRVWTIKLRNNAKWHATGERLTAEDAKLTYDRLKSMAAGSFYSYASGRIESMTVGEDGSLVVTMRQAGLASLYALTVPIMRGGAAEANALPSGTGPYKVASASDDEVRLEVNPNWWKQSPYIEAITFIAKDNNEIAVASYAAGQLDLVPTSLVSVGRYREEGMTQVVDIMTQTAEVMLINGSNALLGDVKVRKALAYAIDRGRIITNVYMNRAQASDVPVAPDSWLYESKSKVFDYNKAQAAALLGEAGWADADGDGVLEKDANQFEQFKLTLLVNDSTDGTRKAAAEQIASQLSEIGIEVTLVTAPHTFGDDESAYMQKLKAGEFDLAMIGFNISRDADVSALIDAQGSLNYGRYTSATMGQLVANVLTAGDETGYKKAASELQMAFVAEVPFITLYFRLNSLLCVSELKGISGVREPDIMRTVDKWYLVSAAAK